jgi:cytochrome c biogenesis protein CcmG, thiol:disulfide interchange protein DsbE
MSQRSRESRRAARAREQSAARRRWLLPAIGAAVIAVAAIAAIWLSSGSSGGGSTERPSDLPSASVSADEAPVVSGTPLPQYEPGAPNDPAVGQTIPTVTSPTGSIELDGTAKVILFLAHWCPHCQAEAPVVQAWVDAGNLPDDVELISVSTAIDPNRPNYPPREWLEREDWTAPVIEDESGAVANAYGMTAFPYFVFVNADGTVAGRTTGELPTSDLDTIIAGLQR